MTRLNLNVEIDGDTVDDLELALNEVTRLVKEGFLSGFNGNDTGDFRFQITDSRDA